LILDTLIQDYEEKSRLFSAIKTIPIIKRKADWAMQWISGNENFAERLLGFAVVEGIHFCSSFCAIFYMKKRGMMPGLCFSNELISRDESMHVDFAISMYKSL
jgi:ribonucleotide reductase beta subunit family protein with ferritin-like domain